MVLNKALYFSLLIHGYIHGMIILKAELSSQIRYERHSSNSSRDNTSDCNMVGLSQGVTLFS